MQGGTLELSELPMSELEAAVELATADMSTFSTGFFGMNRVEAPSGPNAWVTFEATVRSAASTALGKLRSEGGPPCTELLRLCEFEEQTRCQAFQAAMMGEVGPSVYQATARSIVEKLLGKLETYAPEPSLYQAAAQCLSEYMSALNHHCDICAVPQAPHNLGLPAIAEGISEAGVSSDYPSELGSEDAETLSVHSEATDGSHRRRWASEWTAPVVGGVGAGVGAIPPGAISSAATSAPMGVGGGGGAGGGSCEAGCSSGCGSGCGSGGCSSGFSLSEEQMRKERRREANKKASVKYRSKKASSVQSILNDQTAARQQVAALTSQNAVLTAENQLLKQQVAFLQGLIQGQGQGAAIAGMPSALGPSALGPFGAPPIGASALGAASTAAPAPPALPAAIANAAMPSAELPPGPAAQPFAQGMVFLGTGVPAAAERGASIDFAGCSMNDN